MVSQAPDKATVENSQTGPALEKPGTLETVQSTRTKISYQLVFKLSGLLGAQFTKAFYFLTCYQTSACSQKGFNTWLLQPGTFTHPYSIYHSWIQYPVGYYYVAAPYGLAWYALNITAVLGWLPWMLSLFLVDSLISWKIVTTHRWPMIIAWMLSSQFFLNWDPVDYHTFAFSVLGMYSPVFSIAALLVKIPIGAPGYVWDFILHSPYSLGNWVNWGRYAWFGAWWVYGVQRYYRAHRGLKPYISSMFKNPLPARKDFD